MWTSRPSISDSARLTHYCGSSVGCAELRSRSFSETPGRIATASGCRPSMWQMLCMALQSEIVCRYKTLQTCSHPVARRAGSTWG